MNEEKHKRDYNTDDIKKYIEGKMSPQEMHALEKAALEDEFLADALHGMQLYAQEKGFETFAHDIRDLKARMGSRLKSGKHSGVLVMRGLWWKVAAVLFVIITGIAIIFFVGESNRTEKDIAQKEAGRQSAGDSMASEFAPTDSSIHGQSTAMQQVDTAEKAANTAPKNPAASRSKVTEPPSSDEVATVSPSLSTLDKAEKADAPSSLHDSVNMVEASESAKVSRTLQSKAAGVNVSKDRRSRRFNDSLSQSDNNNLDEVVVVASGQSDSQKKPAKPLSEEKTRKRIVPNGGWEAFEEYVRSNKRQSVADSTMSGKQKVTFIIDTLGRPIDIRILESLSHEHDSETIRLLEQGPTWQILRGNRRNVTISIVY
jgi:outer membrane biosynthesis protein TonB